MKRIFLVLTIFLLASPAFLPGQLFKIGPYAGYFRANAPELEEIYKEGELIFGGRAAINLWRGFYLWFSYSHCEFVSKTTFSEEITVLMLNPATVSLRYQLRTKILQPYIGAGYTYLRYKEEAAIGQIKGTAGDISYEGGLELKLSANVGFDIGVRYERLMVNPTDFPSPVDLGGLQAGLTLIISF